MEQRNADWKKINETLNLGGHGRKAGGILDQFDYVFWMGDLNYRINMGSNKVALAKSLLAKENPEIDVRKRMKRTGGTLSAHAIHLDFPSK